MNRYIKSSVKVIAAMVAFGAFPAFAEGDVAVENVQIKCTDALKGFTVGADLAYNYSEAKHDQNEAYLVVGGTRLPADKTFEVKHRRCNIDPSINVGYTHLYNNWYIGVAGEFSFGKDGKKYETYDEVFPTKSKISGFAGGIKVKGGYYIKDLKSAAYGIAGLKWRNVEMQYSHSNGAVGSKAKLKSPLYVLGVGLERPIYKKLSVSAEYEYAWRNSNDTSVLGSPIGNAEFHIKQRLNDHSFKIGVKYHI